MSDDIKNTSDFDKRMISKLKESGHIKHVFMKDVFDDMSRNLISELSKSTLKILITEAGVEFVDENGDRIICPNFGSSISADGEWLSSKLPSINFDIDQGGNLRKAEEAEAAYCCCMVCLVLNDELFSRELDDVISTFDFIEFSAGRGNMSFKDLLVSWQDLQSHIINVTVSAAKFRISDTKKDTEKFLRDGIRKDLVVELRSLSLSIASINREYSTGVLSPEKVKSLTKIEILQHLQRKTDAIESQIRSSKAETIYRILTLSSEYVSPITKKRLNNLANSEVNDLVLSNPDLVTLVGDKTMILDKWKRRYIKLAKISVQKEEVLKYNENPTDYKLPVKM